VLSCLCCDAKTPLGGEGVVIAVCVDVCSLSV